MAHPKLNKTFAENLELSAQVDEIFKDPGPSLGSDPYDENEKTLTPMPTSYLTKNTPSHASLENKASSAADASKIRGAVEMFSLLTADCSFKEFMQRLLGIFQEAAPSERASVLEVDYLQKCIFFRAVCNVSSANLFAIQIPMGEGVAGFVAENRMPLVLSNVDESAMYLASVQKLVGFTAQNMVAFPIVIRGRTFGVVELFNRIGEKKFSKADQEVLTTLAEMAAMVIENRLIMGALSRAANLPKSQEAA